MRIYIAAPFFNEEQVRRVNLVRDLLMKEYGERVEVYSPMHDAKRKLGPGASKEDAKVVFDDNMHHLYNADLVIAILDDQDTGTYFEIGAVLADRDTYLLGLVFDPESWGTRKDRYVAPLDELKGIIKIIGEEEIVHKLKILNVESKDKVEILSLGLEAEDKNRRGLSFRYYRYLNGFSGIWKPDMVNSYDYIMIKRELGLTIDFALIYGLAYSAKIPLILIGSQAKSNLMLQPSTTYLAKDLEDAEKFILENRGKKKKQLVESLRDGYGILGSEEVI